MKLHIVTPLCVVLDEDGVEALRGRSPTFIAAFGSGVAIAELAARIAGGILLD